MLSGIVLLLAAIPVLAECPDLLDVDVRPLAQRGTVILCDVYAGQVLLVVNTASNCGFTDQYEGLETLHQAFADRGFCRARLSFRRLHGPGV